MELERLVAALAPDAVLGSPDPVEVRDLAYDARAVMPGAAFFAVPGERADGHDFAGQAVANGASVLVVERAVEPQVPQLVVPSARAAMATAADVFFGEPTRELQVAGVTGTSGKTTSAFLLHSVLEAAGRRPGLLGTVESRVGGEVRPVVRTTPEAIDLQRTFREMLDAGNRSVALEASSHASVLHRLDRVRFDALVFTNLSQDHLDFHGTMEEYFAAKRRLFTGAAPPPAAVNVGEPWGRRLADELADAQPCPARHVRAGRRRRDPAGGPRPRPGRCELQRRRDRGAHDPPRPLQRRERPRRDRRRDPARRRRGRDRRRDRRSAGCAGPVRGGRRGQPFTVVVDYAHKPDALDNVLRTARELADGRVVVVFGAGGDRDRQKRPLMGKVARDLADVVIVTSDNPRSEDPLAIIQDVLQGTGTDVEIDADRRSAIGRAIELAAPGDVVVIAGKGHEQGQEVAGEKLPFDDRVVAREALRA